MGREELNISAILMLFFAFVFCSLCHCDAEGNDLQHCSLHCNGSCCSMMVEEESILKPETEVHRILLSPSTFHKSILAVEIDHPPKV